METKKNEFIIDSIIAKYQTLSRNEKSIIDFSIAIFFVIFLIGSMYNGGKAIGKFLYYFNN